MEQDDNKPKWLLELENRKRKPRLAHETGAGAPCLTCESACPGLDLHFWRKICKNCKCRGDNHDVDDDDFPQFQLLFGSNVKNKKNRSILLPVLDKKQAQAETPFEWVPPDTTKELATDYMKALPSEKMPIKGSSGAALRRQQLQKQLPLHDIDHKACDTLTEQEKKEFEKYLDNLKNCAGQGKVTKLTSIRPFDKAFMTPVNATDVQRFSPQHSKLLLHPSSGLNLRTPSSFISKIPPTQTNSNLPNSSNLHESMTPITPNIDVLRTEHLEAINEASHKPGRYYHTVTNVSNKGSLAETTTLPSASNLEKNQRVLCNSQKSQNSTSKVEYNQDIPTHNIDNPLPNKLKAYTDKIGGQIDINLEFSSDVSPSALIAEQMMSEALLPPSAINTTNIVGSSLDKNGLTYIQEKLNDKYSNKSDNQISMIPGELDHFSYLPSSTSSDDIKKNTEEAKEIKSKLNPNESNKSSLNYYSPYTIQTEPLQAEINTSLPVQSNVIHSETLNHSIFPHEPVGASGVLQGTEDISQLQEEMEGLTMNVSKTHVCRKCGDDIHCGDVVVTAEKIKDAVWHPGCFVCSACNELLVDLVYFTYKGNLYCGRDLSELLEIPRCFACDELIFVREYTVAEDHNYHVKHFCCWDCDIPLAGLKYISENDRPLCLPCYQKYYAKTCNTCNNVIAADQQGVAIKNLNFHATDGCFCCFTCKKSLLDGQIAIKENKPLCSKECIAEFLQFKSISR